MQLKCVVISFQITIFTQQLQLSAAKIAADIKLWLAFKLLSLHSNYSLFATNADTS